MSDDKKQCEDNLVEDLARIWEEVSRDPELQDVTVPTELRERIYQSIEEVKAKEEAKQKKEQEKELIRLGMLYKRKQRYRKYWALVAVLILAMAMGINSMGGPKRLFEYLSWTIGNREQENVNSDDIVPSEYFDEDEAYEAIEEKYGFTPVRIANRPENVGLLEASIGDEIQGANLVFGYQEEVNIFYVIRPGFRDGSWGKDVEDRLVETEKILVGPVEITLKEYRVEQQETRWRASFTHQDVQYSLLFCDLKEAEVRNVLNNLYFN